ncbi:hypothetical protein QFZ31_005911 [Neobacillus niacini]|uniref:hypothetical protein n=1 Tax=Neobacillus driksii TaxID=3035913 RepID=UPI002788A1AC|nr:hypothetical protein [Neobacillus niacini]MDQ0976033.1 hypothetical protein [Neobacillus niacini]
MITDKVLVNMGIKQWAKQKSEITKITPNIADFSYLFLIWEQNNMGANKILCMG